MYTDIDESIAVDLFENSNATAFDIKALSAGLDFESYVNKAMTFG